MRESLGKFLRDKKRLNVALTRARSQLIVVGDPDMLKKDQLWRSWINDHALRLPRNAAEVSSHVNRMNQMAQGLLGSFLERAPPGLEEVANSSYISTGAGVGPVVVPQAGPAVVVDRSSWPQPGEAAGSSLVSATQGIMMAPAMQGAMAYPPGLDPLVVQQGAFQHQTMQAVAAWQHAGAALTDPTNFQGFGSELVQGGPPPPPPIEQGMSSWMSTASREQWPQVVRMDHGHSRGLDAPQMYDARWSGHNQPDMSWIHQPDPAAQDGQWGGVPHWAVPPPPPTFAADPGYSAPVVVAGNKYSGYASSGANTLVATQAAPGSALSRSSSGQTTSPGSSVPGTIEHAREMEEDFM